MSPTWMFGTDNRVLLSLLDKVRETQDRESTTRKGQMRSELSDVRQATNSETGAASNFRRTLQAAEPHIRRIEERLRWGHQSARRDAPSPGLYTRLCAKRLARKYHSEHTRKGGHYYAAPGFIATPNAYLEWAANPTMRFFLALELQTRRIRNGIQAKPCSISPDGEAVDFEATGQAVLLHFPAGEINTGFQDARIQSQPDERFSQKYRHDVPVFVKTAPGGQQYRNSVGSATPPFSSSFPSPM